MDFLIAAVIHMQAPALSESTLAFMVRTPFQNAYDPPPERKGSPDRSKGGGTRT